jgi:hypothetical protein
MESICRYVCMCIKVVTFQPLNTILWSMHGMEIVPPDANPIIIIIIIIIT